MYNMNLDNVTHLPNGDPCGRTDELGHFVMRYSDDAGRHWSEQRYEVPYRWDAYNDCIIRLHRHRHHRCHVLGCRSHSRLASSAPPPQDAHLHLKFPLSPTANLTLCQVPQSFAITTCHVRVCPSNVHNGHQCGSFSCSHSLIPPPHTHNTRKYMHTYRLTPLDEYNTYGGKVKLMWCVDQVKEAPNGWAVYGFTKIGGYVQNAPQELWFLASDNMLSDSDNASNVRWTLLPNGDHGILPPGVSEGPPADPTGDVFEEAHILPLAVGGYYVVGRTTQGFLGATHTNATLEEGLPLDSFSRTGYVDQPFLIQLVETST